MTVIRIIEPSGVPDRAALEANMTRLRDAGFSLRYSPTTRHPDFPMSADSAPARARALEEALTETSSDIVYSARGGYGASELLPLLDFDRIARAPAKPLIGFSDVCALHSAFLSQLGRCGLHAPMPGSALFGQNSEDIDSLISLLSSPPPWHSSIRVRSNSPGDQSAQGWLFGGNLAVLTNLIGTPWFPRSLAGAIVFLEDVGENAGRLGRYLSQWVQAGKTQDLRALVLGNFSDGSSAPKSPASNRQTRNDKADFNVITHELARRVECPVFLSDDFGHVSPNYPMAIGADASIENGSLNWSMEAVAAVPQPD